MNLDGFIGFLGGLLFGIIFWFPVFFAPAALFSDVNKEMPGWAMAASVWWIFAFAVLGGFIGHRGKF